MGHIFFSFSKNRTFFLIHIPLDPSLQAHVQNGHGRHAAAPWRDEASESQAVRKAKEEP